MLNSLPVSVKVTGAADGTAVEYLVNPLDGVGRVSGFTIMPNVAITANDTNYITVTITKGVTTLATQTTQITGGAAMVIGTAIEMTLGGSAVGTALEIASGGVIKVAITEAGTGPAFDFKVITKFTHIRQ